MSEIRVNAYIGKIQQVEVPYYTGETSVSVTDTPITLSTHGKRLEDDITINQGYGPYAGRYDHYVYAGLSTLPTKNKYLTDDLKVQIGYPQNEEPREYTVLDNDVTIHTQNSYFPYGDRFDITVHQGYPEYTGQTSVSVTNSTVTLATNGKRLDSDITIEQGYPRYTGDTDIYYPSVESITLPTRNKILRDNIEFRQNVYNGSTQISLLGESVRIDVGTKYCPTGIEVVNGFPLYTGPKSVFVTDSTVTLATNGKRLDSDITISQGIPLYTGATSYVIEDSGLTIATNGKRLNSNITVDISALETLADEISEVVG